MNYLIQALALLIGANTLQDPKPCECTRQEQNILVHPGKDAIVHVYDYNKSKCMALVNARLIIGSENMFDEITVSLVSSKRGTISTQVTTGALSIDVKHKFRLRKHEQIWLTVYCKNEDHLITYRNEPLSETNWN